MKYQCRIIWDGGEEWYYFNSSFDKFLNNDIGFFRENAAALIYIYPPRNVSNEFFLQSGEEFRKYGPIHCANNGRESYK